MAVLVNPDLRLSGALVSLKGMRDQVIINTFNDTKVYGMTPGGSCLSYDIATGMIHKPQRIEERVWCAGDKAQFVVSKWEIDYSSPESVASSILRYERWQETGAPNYLVAEWGWNHAQKASESAERFLIMILQGQADGKQLLQGYRGLGGPEYFRFTRLHEGGVAYTPTEDDPFWYNVLSHLS